MKKNGFSLVELIIAITIIGVVGVVTSTILSRTFRANSQSDSISKLKQNGDLALTPMVETIRSAEGVICYDPTAPIQSLVVRTFDGKYIKFRFVDPNLPTTNGYMVKQENLSSSQFSSFCTSVLGSPSPDEVPITNKDTVSGVNISNGIFTYYPGNAGKDTITIKFDVNPTLTSGGTAETKIVQMQTTVQIR